MSQIATHSTRALAPDETRHLLRRLVFTSTPALERQVRGQSAARVLDGLVREAQRAAIPPPPSCVQTPWTNTALRTPGMTDERYDALRAAQVSANRADIDLIRRWWIAEMISGSAPLRENLALFFEGTFGGSTEVADVPHAIHGRNALIRRHCLATVPALLEALIVDPAMLMQIGMDEHFRVRVSDRPAKLVLDHWTVGAGAYSDGDVENLSRALTGWHLVAPPGHEPQPAPDPRAVRAGRRTGIVATFVPEQADTRSKTILGTTGTFDAHSAIRLLARHPATARRFGDRLLQHLGVESPGEPLRARVTEIYQATDGSIPAMLNAIVTSEEFWSPQSRWALIKSPVHLVVGACRQIGAPASPPAGVTAWLKATGQTLFDTPNGGEGGWPDQQAWVTPPDRLAVRYQLPVVLAGGSPDLGVRKVDTDSRKPFSLPLDTALARLPATAVLDRLDLAPGLDRSAVARDAGSGRVDEIVRRGMMTPQYQLA